MAQPQPTIQVAFGTDPGTVPANSAWSDITTKARLASCRRGRSSETDQFQPGTATVLLDNSARDFDPAYTSSPYYPNVKPMRRIRIGAGYMPMVMADSPAAYWRLGESSGTTASDELAGFNGTYIGSPTLGVSGRLSSNTAVTLDGSTQWVTLPVLNIGNQTAYTYEAWIKTSTNAGCILSESDTTSTNKWTALFIVNHKLEIDQRNDAGTETFFDQTGAGVVDDGAWHHVALTRSGTTYTLYRDGVNVGSTTLTQGTTTYATATIGALRRTTTTNKFNGTIDEVAVYTRALSAAEILEHYNEGAAGLADGWRFTGFVERWPQTWPHPVNDATVELTAVDGLAVLASLPIKQSVYESEVRADSPSHWWRLNDTIGDTARDSIGAAHGTYTGLPNRGGPQLVAGDTTTSIEASPNPYTGDTPSGIEIPGGFTITLPFTIEAVVRTHDLMSGSNRNQNGCYYFVVGGVTLLVEGVLLANPGAFNAGVFDNQGNVRTARSSARVDDGGPHHLALTCDTSSNLKLYVDGVLDTVAEVSTGTLSASSTFRSTPAYLCTEVVQTNAPKFDGFVQDIAYYPTALSAARIAAHAAAMSAPWENDTTGARVGRVLDTVGWPSADRNVDTGNSTLQQVQLAGAALAELQKVERSEQGALFIQKDGKLRFRARRTVLTSSVHTTAQATFGDANDGTETPYTAIDRFDYGVDKIINEVRGNRRGGAVVSAVDTASQTAYLARVDSSTLADLDVVSDAEMVDAVHWRLTHYKDPLTRPLRIEVTPSSAADWNAVLGREIGDRVSLVRRPPGGGTVTTACLIEAIADDWQPGNATFSFDVSLAETQTYWILGTSGLGNTSGQTTRLAY